MGLIVGHLNGKYPLSYHGITADHGCLWNGTSYFRCGSVMGKMANRKSRERVRLLL
jgi:hypothetical protein